MDNSPLMMINNGLSIVSSKRGEQYNGLIVHAAFEVNAGGPAIVVAVNQNNLTYDYIKESRAFTVSVLEQETPMSLIGLFGFKSGRDNDKFAGVEFVMGKSGVPYVVTNSLAFIETQVIQTFNIASLTFFVGKVVHAGVLKEGAPLTTYHYQTVMNGKFPKTSSLYGEQMLYFG
jgi:ferric-chelate reductase [NAD(P)H]